MFPVSRLFLLISLSLILLIPVDVFAGDYDLRVNRINFGSASTIGSSFNAYVLLANNSPSSNPDGGEGTFDVRYQMTRPDGTTQTLWDDNLSFVYGELKSRTKSFTLTQAGQYTLVVNTYTNDRSTLLHQDNNSDTQKLDTSLSADNKSFYPGESVTFRARLVSGSTGIASKSISFSVPGASGSATTDSNGYASRTLSPSGSGTISVSFGGDSSYESSSDTASLSKNKFDTHLQGATISAVTGDSVNIWGRLQKENASGNLSNYSGQTITLTLDGTSKNVVTNSSGIGSASFTAPSTGSYTYSIEYDGNSDYQDASGSGTLTVSVPPVNAGVTSVRFANSSARIGLEDALPQVTIKNTGTQSAQFKVKLEVVDTDSSSATNFSTTVTSSQLSSGSSWTYTGAWTPSSTHAYAVIATVYNTSNEQMLGTGSAPNPRASSDTTFDENEAPGAAASPSPANGSVGNSRTPTLGWTGNDPDGDSLKYNVYFGTSASPPLVSQEETGTSWTPPSELDPSTRYYWRVDSMDDSATTMGQSWSFWTEEAEQYTGMLFVDIDGFKYGVKEAEKGGSFNYSTQPVKVYDISANLVSVPDAVSGTLFACIQSIDAIKDSTGFVLGKNAQLAAEAGLSLTVAAMETIAVDSLGLVVSQGSPTSAAADYLTGGLATAASIVGMVADVGTQTMSTAVVLDVASKAHSTQYLLTQTSKSLIEQFEATGEVDVVKLKRALMGYEAAKVLGDIAFVLYKLVIESTTMTVDQVATDIMQVNPDLPFIGAMWSAYDKGRTAGDLLGDLVVTLLHFAPQLVDSVTSNLFALVEGKLGPPEYFYEPDGSIGMITNNPPAPTFYFNKVKCSVGETITINATESIDADGDMLTYFWYVSGPEGSTAQVAAPGAATTSFTPDVPGTYLVKLVLYDGHEYAELSGGVFAQGTEAPVISITTPSQNKSIAYDVTSVLFEGTANDPDGTVTTVEYRVAGGSWVSMAGGDTWTFTAALLAVGDNLVEVRAYDDDYNVSPVASLLVTRRVQDEPEPTESITLLAPTGGENLVVGQQYSVRWSPMGELHDTVDLQYSVNSGVTWEHMGSVENSGSYTWTVHPDACSESFRLKVIGYKGAEVFYDTSGNIDVSPRSDETRLLADWSFNSRRGTIGVQQVEYRDALAMTYPADSYYPGPGQSVEITSNRNNSTTLYKYGVFEGRLQAAPCALNDGVGSDDEGVVSTLFTYWREQQDDNNNGRTDTSEIDIELFGHDPGRIYMTIHTAELGDSATGSELDAVKAHYLADMRTGKIYRYDYLAGDYTQSGTLDAKYVEEDFDCTDKALVYGFEWQANFVEWYVYDGDEKVVLVRHSIIDGVIPEHPAFFLANVWYTPDWKAYGVSYTPSLLAPANPAPYYINWISSPVPVTDSDGDNLPDGWEVDTFGSCYFGASDDADSDDLSNLAEYQNVTNPKSSDSDGDLMPDGWEVANNLQPLVADASGNPDNDEFTNLQEYLNGTDPQVSDSATGGGNGGVMAAIQMLLLSDTPAPVQAEENPGWRHFKRDMGGTGSDNTKYAARSIASYTEAFSVPFTYALSGDVTGDGVQELVVSTKTALEIYNGSGQMVSEIPSPPTNMVFPVLEDINGDGKNEIIVGSTSSSIMRINIYSHTGVLLKTLSRNGGSDAHMYPVAYLGDNRLAVAYSAGYSRDPRGYAVWNLATEIEEFYYDVGPTMSPYSIGSVGDTRYFAANSFTPHNGASGSGIDGTATTTTDRDLYLIVIDEHGNEIATQKLGGELSGGANGSTDQMVTDLEGDGVHEIVTTISRSNSYQGTAQVRIYNVDGTLRHSATQPGTNAALYVLLTDIDSDGTKEIAVLNWSTGVVTVYGPTLNVIRQSVAMTAQTMYMSSAADIDGDGRKELFLRDGTELVILDGGTLAEERRISFPARVGRTWACDLNNDNIAEIVVSTQSAIHVLQ